MNGRRQAAGIGRALRQSPVIAAVLSLSVVLALVFALRLAFAPDPDARDPEIAGWMPVGYVARTWDVPREVLAEALGLQPGNAPRRSLRSLAEERGEPVEALIVRLRAAIADHRGDGP